MSTFASLVSKSLTACLLYKTVATCHLSTQVFYAVTACSGMSGIQRRLEVRFDKEPMLCKMYRIMAEWQRMALCIAKLTRKNLSVRLVQAPTYSLCNCVKSVLEAPNTMRTHCCFLLACRPSRDSLCTWQKHVLFTGMNGSLAVSVLPESTPVNALLVLCRIVGMACFASEAKLEAFLVLWSQALLSMHLHCGRRASRQQTIWQTPATQFCCLVV